MAAIRMLACWKYASMCRYGKRPVEEAKKSLRLRQGTHQPVIRNGYAIIYIAGRVYS